MTATRTPELDAWLETQREIAQLVAHDLRNPLAALMANINYLQATVKDRDALDALGDMQQSADGLLRLVEMQTTIARLEARPTLPHGKRELFAPDVIVAAVRARWEPLVAVAGVTVDVGTSGTSRDIQGDRALFEQTIDALVANVLQHVRRGERARLEVAFGEEVCVSLDDEGPAFGVVERDFSRSGQLDLKKRSDARYSRGLGLYLVGLTTAAMGGRVEIASGATHGCVRLWFA